jgi:hypothetical protein
LISGTLKCKKDKIQFILAQNFRGNNADIEYIRYEINFEYNIFTRKIANTHIILAQNCRENEADFG